MWLSMSHKTSSPPPPPVMVFTAPLAVVRVDVHNDVTWETRSISLAERSKYLYREDDLKTWVEPIYELAWQADQVSRE